MRRSRLAALGALTALVMVAATAGVAPAASSPSATASQAFVSGSPSAIACGGSIDAQVTINGQAGSTGASTDVMLVLDLSGSTAGKLADLRRAGKDALDALDAADGATDQAISGNAAGVVTYQGTTGTVIAGLGSSYETLLNAVNSGTSSSTSPHGAGISTAAGALGASSNGYASSMVLISDGIGNATEVSNASTAATTAKGNGVRILAVGIGSDANQTNLSSWASQSSYYQSGTPNPIDKTKLVSDLGAAAAVPVNFTLTETLGSTFSAAPVSSSTGTVTPGAGTLVWAGTLTGSQSATFVYRATRNGSEVFAPTNELVSTMSLAVSGGTATVTPPAALSIDVLACGSTPLATTTCTGSACSASGSQGGVQYSANAGAPPAGTTLLMSSLNAPAPPAGVCPGFTSHTQGAEVYVRPLSTDVSIRMVIPRASLGSLRWFQTNVCLGSNLRFITAIQSLSNLFPNATFVPGGSVPGRWWGLLPSIPRIAWFPGRGFVLGPYITSRSQDSAGNAVINFRVPFVSNSTGLTTDGKAGYDPKWWG